MCWFIFVNACAFIPSADAADTVGVKTERNEKGGAYFPVHLFDFC